MYPFPYPKGGIGAHEYGVGAQGKGYMIRGSRVRNSQE